VNAGVRQALADLAEEEPVGHFKAREFAPARLAARR